MLPPPSPGGGGGTTAEQGAASAHRALQRAGAAIEESLSHHLNLMLRPQMAARLRATAVALSTAAEGAAAQEREGPSYALPFLGESLLAALDLSGSSSPAQREPPRPPPQSRPTWGTDSAPRDGAPELVPFTAFDEEREGTGAALEGSPGNRGGGAALSRSWDANTSGGRAGLSGAAPELQPFTGFDPSLPGAEMALGGGSLEGGSQGSALEGSAMEGGEEEEAVDTADDWGFEPFEGFGGQRVARLGEMASSARKGAPQGSAGASGAVRLNLPASSAPATLSHHPGTCEV